MYFDDFDEERHFRELWEAVSIARPVAYSLFTFGESQLPYYLICGTSDIGVTVTITQGEVHIKRPLIITPETARGEFRNFFENTEERDAAEFLLARSAHFRNLRLDNYAGESKMVSDNVEEVVAKLNRKLDDEEEDRTAILTAPPDLGGVALLRYAAERVWESAPDNIQELRERGFLP
jgi:predicted transcriptional regulator